VNENEDLLALDVTTDDTGTTVSVVGELDPHTVPELEGLLTELIGATPTPPRVTLELSGVRFVDSSGLRVILSAREGLLQQDARLVLRSPSDAVLRLLEITDLLGRLDVEQD
jgi:anti-sigma B factor antagonist